MNDDWVMPKWMEPFRDSLTSQQYTVEELMNMGTLHIPTYSWKEIAVGRLRAQVALLERLHASKII